MKNPFAKEAKKVLDSWKDNKTSYMRAASELVDLGYSVEQAYNLLAKT